MLFRIFTTALGLIGRLLKKRFVYVEENYQGSGRTAAKTALGFWCVGNVLDMADISYGIARSGVIEVSESALVTAIIKRLSQAGPVVFYDIGANIGYYGLLAAHLGCRVVSFEPVKAYIECLKESVKINDFEEQFRIFDCALGEKDGTAVFYEAGSGSTLNPAFIDGKSERAYNISVKTLDSLNAGGLNPPQFIKIDVEGFEFSVLKGGQEIISRCQPIIFIEIAKTLKNIGREFTNADADKVFDFFLSRNFRVLVNDAAQWKFVDKSYAYDGVKMFLCVPQRYHSSIQEFITV